MPPKVNMRQSPAKAAQTVPAKAKAPRVNAPSPVASEPKGRNKAQKRPLIRQAAYRRFAESGFHETTVDDICREAGISKGAFYWHFDGKQEVFLDILHVWADEVEAELAAQFQGAVLSTDAYDAITLALVREAKRARRIMPVWLEFLAQGARDPNIRQAIATFHRRIRTTIAELLEPMLVGTFDQNHLQSLAGTLLAAFMGLVCQELGDPEKSDFSGNARRFMDMLQLFVRDFKPQ